MPHDERLDLGHHDALQERLEQSEALLFDREEALAAVREELDAVREINRELLSQHNRTPG
jgi:hypothetical protein